MSYAVVLAGIPGRIINDVLADLRKVYSNGYVFRGAGAQQRSDGLAFYDEAEISKIIDISSDAIFGKSSRPHGFCRKGNKPCAIKNASKNDCGKPEGSACLLQKPSNFILIVQEGKNEDNLLSKFHFAPIVSRISSECYSKKEKTFRELRFCIDQARKMIANIEVNISTANSPLLLPPKNFKMNSLKALLRVTSTSGVGKPHAVFRRENFNGSEKAYLNKNGFLFPPARVGIRHGLPSTEENPLIGITHEFRLGCQYPRDFQYDVRRLDNKHFDGSSEFICRSQGFKYPKSKHVNITVDDCII